MSTFRPNFAKFLQKSQIRRYFYAEKQKRPDGRIKSKVYIGQVNGKPQYKYVYAKNNRELEQKIQEVKTKLGKGLDMTAERDSFKYWAEQWLKLKGTSKNRFEQRK